MVLVSLRDLGSVWPNWHSWGCRERVLCDGLGVARVEHRCASWLAGRQQGHSWRHNPRWLAHAHSSDNRGSWQTAPVVAVVSHTLLMHLRCGNGNIPMHLGLKTVPPGRAGSVYCCWSVSGLGAIRGSG
eukprot:jgi/Chrzof1/14955/Cz09g22040.t1